MVLCGITLVPLAEEIWLEDPENLAHFYAYEISFDGSAQRSAHLMEMILERGTNQGYFPETTNSLFIFEFPNKEDVDQREFEAKGLYLNFDGGRWYLGDYLGPREELEA